MRFVPRSANITMQDPIGTPDEQGRVTRCAQYSSGSEGNSRNAFTNSLRVIDLRTATMMLPGAREGQGQRRCRNEDGPATPELWRRHLSGTYGVGVVPMLENGTCFWGCVDLDIYDVDPARIAAQVKALGCACNRVCVQESGGKHVFLWAKVPVPASLMRQRLAELAKALGYPTAERFPKSDPVTECGGNWLNMPWYGGRDSTRVCRDASR